MAFPVVFLPSCGLAVPDTKLVFRWKREAIWNNAGRNVQIATVAEKLAL